MPTLKPHAIGLLALLIVVTDARPFELERARPPRGRSATTPCSTVRSATSRP